MSRLVDVPAHVASVAVAALASRASRQGGGTQRGIVVATALGSGRLTASELAEVRAWHHRHPGAVQGDQCTLLAGLYGGGRAREWLALTAAARNPAGVGAMVSLPIDPVSAKALARDDGEPITELHLTLLHLAGDASTLNDGVEDRYSDLLSARVSRFTAPLVSLTHIERFVATDEGLEPVAAVSDDPGVYELRQDLDHEFTAANLGYGDEHAFRAHVTIGYYPPGDGPEAGLLPEPVTIRPDAVELHWGAHTTRFPFSAPALTAAPPHPATGALERYSTKVARLEQGLARDIYAAAQAAYAEAVRLGGVTLRQKARTAAAKQALIDSSGLATPGVLAAAGLAEQDLIRHRLDTLAALVALWTAATTRGKLAEFAKALNAPESGMRRDDAYREESLIARADAESQRRAELAAGLIIAAVGAYAIKRLTVGTDDGELPFGVVRPGIETATRGGEGRDVDGLVEQLIEERVGDVDRAGVWVHGAYGAPKTPFDPHENLDGETITGKDDPKLTDQVEDWTAYDYNWPGDHNGCTCDIEPMWHPAQRSFEVEDIAVEAIHIGEALLAGAPDQERDERGRWTVGEGGTITNDWTGEERTPVTGAAVAFPTTDAELRRMVQDPRDATKFMDGTPITPDSPLLVFHGTEADERDAFLKYGADPETKPWTLASERYAQGKTDDVTFAPGAGAGRGLYVAGHPNDASGFGHTMVAVTVRAGDLERPPEAEGYGAPGAGALGDLRDGNNGAVINVPVPPENVRQYGSHPGKIPKVALDELTGARTAAYSDDQPRDELGRWTDGGASSDWAVGGSETAGDKITTSDFRAASIVDRVRAQGGLTVKPLTGQEPLSGYVVGLPGGTIMDADRFFATPKGGGGYAHLQADDLFPYGDAERALDKFVDDNIEHFDKGGGLGIWHDEEHGEVAIDMVAVIQDRDEAVALGERLDQQSIYDVTGQDTIDTGGTGGRKELVGATAALHREAPETAVADDPRRTAGLDQSDGAGVQGRRAALDRVLARAAAYSDDQPRDERGRFAQTEGEAAEAGAPIYRGINLNFPADAFYAAKDDPKALAALVREKVTGGWGMGGRSTGLGLHWTTDRATANAVFGSEIDFVGLRGVNDQGRITTDSVSTRVVLEAEPDPAAVRTDPDTFDLYGMTHNEAEVPIRPGAEVEVTRAWVGMPSYDPKQGSYGHASIDRWVEVPLKFGHTAAYSEEDHPRDDHGRFTSGGGGDTDERDTQTRLYDALPNLKTIELDGMTTANQEKLVASVEKMAAEFPRAAERVYEIDVSRIRGAAATWETGPGRLSFHEGTVDGSYEFLRHENPSVAQWLGSGESTVDHELGHVVFDQAARGAVEDPEMRAWLNDHGYVQSSYGHLGATSLSMYAFERPNGWMEGAPNPETGKPYKESEVGPLSARAVRADLREMGTEYGAKSYGAAEDYSVNEGFAEWFALRQNDKLREANPTDRLTRAFDRIVTAAQVPDLTTAKTDKLLDELKFRPEELG